MSPRIGFGVLVFAVFVVVGLLGTTASGDERVNIQWVQLTPDQLHLHAGAELYSSLCASCHGQDARGTGPAGPALKTPPSDLTLIAAEHDGEFPAIHVMEVILGQHTVVAPDAREMPIWGDVFQAATGTEARARLRAFALMKHLESVQESG